MVIPFFSLAESPYSILKMKGIVPNLLRRNLCLWKNVPYPRRSFVMQVFLYFSEKKWKGNTTATKSNTPSEKRQHVTDLWMEASMEDTNATLSFPGHHEVWTDQLTPPLSAFSLLP